MREERATTRRQLLKGGGAALVGLAAGARPAAAQGLRSTPAGLARELMAYGQRSRFVGTSRITLDNKVNMQMHGDPNGFDALTPLGEQMGIITPAPLHFISSHGDPPPDIDPARHRLMIHGMVERPLVFTLAELRRLPSVSRIHYIECLANRPRPGVEQTLETSHGMVGCSEWTGVPLSLLLAEAGVQPGARWVVGESLGRTQQARSFPLGKALLGDTLVAYGQNSEPIQPHNGYPLRLVIPGFEGKFQLKWLRGIKVTDQPYVTYWEHGSFTRRERTPLGSYWEQGPKSVITYPAGGQRLPGRGHHTIVGFAWSGNGAVRRVEVSTDGGRTWADAELEGPALPMAMTRFRHPWTWAGGEAVLQSRCIDERGEVQPTAAEFGDFWGEYAAPHGNQIQPWRITDLGQVLNAL